MNIKTEPVDELSSSENNVHGVYYQTNTNDIKNETISADIGDKSTVKQEEFEDDERRTKEDFLLNNIKLEEDSKEWKNCEYNPRHDFKMEKLEAAEGTSYAEWIPDQGVSLELEQTEKIKKEEVDVRLQQNCEGKISQNATVEGGECSYYAEWKPEEPCNIENKLSVKNEPSLTSKKSKEEPVAVIILEKRVFHERNFACSICCDVFATPSSLHEHRIIHGELSVNSSARKTSKLKLDPSKMRYNCDMCDFKAYYFSQVTTHKVSHSGLKPFNCEMCDFKTAYSTTLKKHILIHSGEKPFKCDQCAYKTTNGSYFKTHKMTHLNEKPFKCVHCEFKCASLYQLTRHKTTHTNIKPFECNLCDFKCRELSHLNSHKKIHTGEKPFSCDQCDFKSAYTSSLKFHKMSHSGEMPFKCDKCDYKSGRSSHLKTHQKTHTGERPFKCVQCEFRCADSTRLKKHVSLSHTAG